MTSIEKLARELAELRRKVDRITPQLASSSIEAGSIREHDLDGNLVGQYGRQFDGTSAPAQFNGPPPPMPTTPTIESVVKGVRVRWDGLFADDAVVPMNFARVELHASTDPLLTAETAATLVSTFETPRGGTVTVSSDPALLYVRLVSRNLAGLRSTATPVVSAAALPVSDADIDSVGVAKLTTGELSAGVRIILGNEAEAHAEATPEGFSVYRRNLENQQIYKSASLGDGDSADMLQIGGTDGLVKASISDSGDVLARNLIVNERVSVGGLDLSELLIRAESTRNVQNFIRMADNRFTGSELGLFEFQFTAEFGHLYSFIVQQLGIEFSTAGVTTDYGVLYRYTSDGSRPSINSPLFAGGVEWHQAGSGGYRDMGSHVFNHFPFFWSGGTPGGTRTFRVLVSMWVHPGALATIRWVSFFGQYTVVQVLDHGLSSGNVFAVDNDGGGTGPPPPPPPQQYYWEGAAWWGASWRGSGSKRTDTADLYQGYYSGTNGRQKSSWGWGDLTPMLAGAVVDRAEAYLLTPHWYNSGGGIVRIGFHQQYGEPADYTGLLAPREIGFARGEGKWIDLHDWKPYIQNGAWRGLAMEAPNDSSTYYGYAAGDGQAGGPILRIWYTK